MTERRKDGGRKIRKEQYLAKIVILVNITIDPRLRVKRCMGRELNSISV